MTTNEQKFLEYARKGDTSCLLKILSSIAEAERVRLALARDVQKETSLHYACRFGDLKLIKFLTDSGADLNARNGKLGTPLHCAVSHGHLPAVRHLLECEVEIDQKDNSGVNFFAVLKTQKVD
ncbi:unnamed protein product [Enterobius vermicularis]|uniref:ANK_REP_REGION domain-containing protein n=1 Tax=Enterobius vermicularis TaxID=51028 RepID=A0A0N4VIU8_ENTVE|nr:unnamed protein product [Enterobius vermicularis]